MYNCTPPAFDMDMYMDSSTPTLSAFALTIPNTSPLSEPETELQWQNGDVVETLLVEPYSRVSYYTAQNFGGTMSGAAVTGTSSVAPANLPLPPPPPPPTTEVITDDRKRQERETESQNEDVEFESLVTKKQVCTSTASKKHRTAKIHNLAERNRRSRINEKMNALRDLIPRCNKIDKASILDEAIEYLKSLQLQVQILSTRGGMVPGMCPGGQQYMPPIIGMNQPMMSRVGMEQPMMSYVGMNQPTMSSVSMSQPIMSTMGMNQPMMSTVGMNQHVNQTQVPLPQIQAVVYPSSINTPRSSRDVGNF